MEQHTTSVPVTSAPTNVTQEKMPAASGEAMDVDIPTTSVQPQGKRKANEEPGVDGTVSKKVRMGAISFYRFVAITTDRYSSESPSAPLKRYVSCTGGKIRY